MAGHGIPVERRASARSVHVEALVSVRLARLAPAAHQALFGVRYRLEIYTPAPQRIHGYYVLPFVFGDTIVADGLKADRAAGVLRVPQLTWEPGAPPGPAALERELAALAGWLELTDVSVPGTTPKPGRRFGGS